LFAVLAQSFFGAERRDQDNNIFVDAAMIKSPAFHILDQDSVVRRTFLFPERGIALAIWHEQYIY